MRFGPLSKLDVESLKTQLDLHGAAYKVDVSQPHVDQAKLRNQNFMINQTYTGDSAYFFIEIEQNDILIVRGMLEKMGTPVYSKAPEPLPEVPEYLCLRCGFVSENPGLCPKHKLRLLEFSDWVEARRTYSLIPKNTQRAIYLLIIILMVGFGIYSTLTTTIGMPPTWFSTFRW